MSSSKKYFKRIVIPVSEVITLSDDLSDEIMDDFIKQLHRVNLNKTIIHLFQKKYDLGKSRLAVNLKRFIDRLSSGKVSSIIPDGLDPDELSALLELHNRIEDPITRSVAQSLCSIEERSAAFNILGPMFDNNRLKFRGKI
jgi:hypothetical protein